MGQQLIKSPWQATANSHVGDQKHSVCQMANGKVALLVSDLMAGTTTASRIHVYVTNRTSAPTVYYFDYANVAATSPKWAAKASMCIDTGGNLHIAYGFWDTTSGNNSLRYRKLTYTAGTDTFAVGAEVTISAYVANRILTAVDIDIPSTSQTYPIIAACWRQGSAAPYTSTVTVYNKTAASSNSYTARNVTGNFASNQVCIATRQDFDVAGSNFVWVLSYNPGPPNVSADAGDFIYIGRASIGGAFVGTPQTIYSGLFKNYNSGYRAWDIFYLTNECFLLHCLVRSSPHMSWHVIIQTDPQADTWSARTNPRTVASAGKWARFVTRFASASQIRVPGDTAGTIVSWQVTTGGVWALTYEWDYDGAAWTVSETKSYALWSRGYTVPSVFLVPWGGERGRFSTPEGIDVMSPHHQMNVQTVVKKVYLWKRPVRPTVSISVPAENGTVTSAMPDLTALVTGVGVDATAIRSKIRFQLSTSNNFSTNVYTIDQTKAQETYYSTTATSVKQPTTNYPLTQATWYARAQIVDQFGGTGPWSATRTFRVSHPPSVMSLYPLDDSVLIYSATGSAFSWKFIDPYSLDKQTAYQVDIYLAGTSTLVVSTGKIISSADSATVVIPVGSKENYLDWVVRVWDQDDVASAAIVPRTVYLTEPPTPVFIYPSISGEDIPTAMPTISWDPGLTGGKTQISYRVQIRNYTNNSLLKDTGIVNTDDDSYTVPAGILHNNIRYSVLVTVTDSTNLDATIRRYFDAIWPVPVLMPRPTAYLDMYDEYGFATVVTSSTGWDVDLVNFHLYRRPVEGNLPWELIYETADISSLIVFKDYFLPAGITSEYALTQLVERFGDFIESSLSDAPRFQINPQNAHYWLIDKTDLEQSMKVPTVTSDSYTPEIEEVSYNVVGRGRQWEVGETVGIAGTLNAQLRDQSSGGFFRENYNFLSNPNLENDAVGNPEFWAWASVGTVPAVIDMDTLQMSPGPTNRRSGRLRIQAQRTSVTSGYPFANLTQTVMKSAYFQILPGSTYFASFWAAIPAPVVGWTLRIQCDWREGVTTRKAEVKEISTDTTTVTAAQVLETRVVNGELWYRIGMPLTPNADVYPLIDRAIIRIGFIGPTNTVALPVVNAYIEGVTLTLGTNPLQYFSGYERSGEWTGVENVDPSFTPGSYTARKQRQKLLRLKEEQHDLYLRNPFGDIWSVFVSNINVEREVGIASHEGVTVEIPYSELRD